MKHLPVILVLLVVGYADIRAQYNFTNEVTSNPFALTYGIDSRLTLFTPDTGAQIIFNPARAALINRQFVVGKYDGYPYYNQSLRTVDVAVLRKDENAFWLFQLTNTINSTSSENENNYEEIMPVPRKHYSKNKRTTENNINQTRMKVSKIILDDATSYSYSLYGSFLPNALKEIYIYTDVFYNNTAISKSTRNYFINEDRRIKTPEYLFGAEIGIANGNSDFIFSGEYKAGKRELRYLNINENSYFDSSASNFNSNYDKSLSSSSSTIDPTTIRANIFYQYGATMFGISANNFVSVNTSYLSGNYILDMKVTNFSKSQSGSNPASGDTSIIESNGSVKGTQYNISFSSGSIVRIDFDELQFQTGVIPSIFFTKNIDGITGSSYYSRSLLIKSEYQKYALDITFPFVVSYAPTEWCMFYSGMNVNYSFDKSDRKDKVLPLTRYFSSANNSSSNYLESGSNSTSTNYTSFSRFFLNMQIQHRSGFKVQISFKDDITRFREHGISMMYFF